MTPKKLFHDMQALINSLTLLPKASELAQFISLMDEIHATAQKDHFFAMKYSNYLNDMTLRLVASGLSNDERIYSQAFPLIELLSNSLPVLDDDSFFADLINNSLKIDLNYVTKGYLPDEFDDAGIQRYYDNINYVLQRYAIHIENDKANELFLSMVATEQVNTAIYLVKYFDVDLYNPAGISPEEWNDREIFPSEIRSELEAKYTKLSVMETLSETSEAKVKPTACGFVL